METQQYTTFPIPVTRSVLDDGLTVWTAERPSETLTAQITLSAGGLDDDAHPGTAHFLEHILYEGPARNGVHPALRSLMLNGARSDAATSKIMTEYWCKGFSGDLRRILSALNEIVFNERIHHPENVERERTVILQEMRGSERDDRYSHWYNKLLFPSIPALHQITTGTPESVANITADTLEAFRERWYQPNYAAVIVCGGITHAQVLDAIGGIPRPPMDIGAPRQRTSSAPVFTRGTYSEQDPATSVRLYFPSSEDRREQEILSLAIEILTESTFGILTQRLRHEQRLIYNIAGSSLGWPLTGVSMTVKVPPQHFAHVEDEMFAGIDRLIHGEYPMEILDAVRAQRRFFFTTRIDGPWVNWLSADWLEGNLEDFDHLSFILAATREDIAAVAAKYLTREQYGVIHVVPPDDAVSKER